VRAVGAGGGDDRLDIDDGPFMMLRIRIRL
jgi:hypothetical protein